MVAVAVVVDDCVDGLGGIVGELLTGNLAEPWRTVWLGHRPWSVAVDVYDAGSVFSVLVHGRSVRISSGRSGRAELGVRVDGDTLMAIPEIPLVAGLPDPRSSAGRDLIGKMVLGKTKVTGLHRHPTVLRRFLGLLTTAEPRQRTPWQRAQKVKTAVDAAQASMRTRSDAR
jgi:hypothetical protein